MTLAAVPPISPRFDWSPQPRTALWLNDKLQAAVKASDRLGRFAARLAEGTGTRISDWLDQLTLPVQSRTRAELIGNGFLEVVARSGRPYWQHPGGLFPLVELTAEQSATRLVLKVDSVADFLVANGIDSAISGEPGAMIREAMAFKDGEIELWVRERHGSLLEAHRVVSLEALARHREAFWLRSRHADPPLDFAQARKLIQAGQAELGPSYACDLFFAEERRFWQLRNRAGQVQFSRQQALGLGWGNHDHHTYRSSREHFAELIAIFELLGFHCRERFHPGKGAGWGAQVLEHAALGIAIFADVDLSPEELAGDFAHMGLSAQVQLGTIGLWCKLHGEAFLAGGMHHLECQFDFDAVTAQLAERGIGHMPPFTDLGYLKQAFTTGEQWLVDPARIDLLEQTGSLTRDQADTIRRQGAIGSHMEILERNQGYKGFNQTGIDEIIAQTDPRRAR
jgi:hypothetical protein